MLRLGFLFGGIYFVQGIGEPTEGLIAQPVRSMLKGWGHGAQDIAAFAALLSLPWSLKPLYGLISDFIPLAGYRRKSYLVTTSVLCIVSLLALYLFPVPFGAHRLLLLWLVVPTLAVAFSDVVADGLMIDEGQPRGLTGRLQAVQWTAMYAATIVAGSLGGYLSQNGHESVGFLICGALAILTLASSIFLVRERQHSARPSGLREAFRSLSGAIRSPAVLSVAGFLFLWNFNPFQHAVLYVHMTDSMGMSEQFFGHTVSILSIASIAACVAYGFYCKRMTPRALVHLSIVTGILATLAYFVMVDEATAILATVVVGFTYMTGTLIQLDLAARTCPPETAATIFAFLMALTNLSTSLSTWLGGVWYDAWKLSYGADTAFKLLVVVGASTTAVCWIMIRSVGRSVAPIRDQPI
jgi:predicted MFS family arabinose efflux permease